MIPTIAYLFLTAALIGCAALLCESLCAELGRPRRSAWLIALGASVALPAQALFFGAAPTSGSPIFELPPLIDFRLSAGDADIGAVAPAVPGDSTLSWPDWQVFDQAVTALWAVSSAAMLLLCAAAAWRLRRLLRDSPRKFIGGQEVLVADRLGPAVLGSLQPRIVIPRWLASQDSALRTLVLRHEREHIAARDQLALLAALLIVALMPWNLALWWQLRRLRGAMEVDCDTRVLRHGVSAREYSEALLTVGQHSRRAPFASIALNEPVSELERRIGIMLEKSRGFSLARFSARFALACSVLVLAFAVNAPSAQDAPPAPAISATVSERLAAAKACMDRGNRDGADCATRILDEVAAMPDLNVHETAELYNSYASVHVEQEEYEAAIDAYNRILALPDSELPDELIRSAMRPSAQLYAVLERYNESLERYQRWMRLPGITPVAEDHYFLAVVHYQLEQYQDALSAVQQAVAESEEPVERYYALLHGLQLQTGDAEGARRTLGTLNELWPKEAYANALAGAEAQNATPAAGAGRQNPPQEE